MNSLGENLLQASEHLTGLVIVMMTLGILWGVTALMGRIVTRFERPAVKPAPVPAGPALDSAADVDDDLVVVAAAVATMLDAPHRVVSVRPQPSSWGQQGRREIHASHRIR